MNSVPYQTVPVTCPNCKYRFLAPVMAIIDAGQSPEAKALFLSGQINVAVCPQCGNAGVLNTPLVYHDPDKELLLTYVPQELGMNEFEQQRLVGDLTNRLISSLPAERRKGYLLRPKNYLRMEALVQEVLQAEGITPEMLEAQRARINLLERLLQAANEETRRAIAQANDEQIGIEFMDLLALNIELAERGQQQALMSDLMALREQLLRWTTIGREIAAREDAIRSLGEEITREGLLDKVVEAALNNEPVKVETLVAIGRPAIDYVFYQRLAEQITAAQQAGDRTRADKLNALRQTILDLTAEMDAEARQVAEQASQFLRQVLESENPRQVLQANARRVDNLFMSVLTANLEAAQRAGQMEMVTRLEQVRAIVLELIMDSQPPEIQLINRLLSVDYPEGTRAMLEEMRDQIDPELLEVMRLVGEELAQSGRADAAQRLNEVRSQAQSLASLD